MQIRGRRWSWCTYAGQLGSTTQPEHTHTLPCCNTYMHCRGALSIGLSLRFLYTCNAHGTRCRAAIHTLPWLFLISFTLLFVFADTETNEEKLQTYLTRLQNDAIDLNITISMLQNVAHNTDMSSAEKMITLAQVMFEITCGRSTTNFPLRASFHAPHIPLYHWIPGPVLTEPPYATPRASILYICSITMR